MPKLTCEYCGREFYSGRSDRKTCSTAHRVALHRQRQQGKAGASDLAAERDRLNRLMERDPSARTRANYAKRDQLADKIDRGVIPSRVGLEDYQAMQRQRADIEGL